MTHELTPERLNALRNRLAEQDQALTEVCEVLRAHPDIVVAVDPRDSTAPDDGFETAAADSAPACFGALGRC
jgi:hypothetical protein